MSKFLFSGGLLWDVLQNGRVFFEGKKKKKKLRGAPSLATSLKATLVFTF